MNLIQSKQLVEWGQPKPTIHQFKQCLRVFRKVSELCPQNRIELLEALQSKISYYDEQDPLIARVRAAISLVHQEKQLKEERISVATQECRDWIGMKLELFADYAILDSMPEVPGSEAGLSEGRAIQFFLSHLKQFNHEFPTLQVNQLIQSLESLFEMNVYIYDQSSDVIGRIKHSIKYLKSQVLEMLQQLSEGEIPYFFLPCSSKDHAMIGKVEWVDGEGYLFTIINTGCNAQFRRGAQAADLVYRNLDQKDVMAVVRVLLLESLSAQELYSKIENALPLNKRSRFKGREHGLQKKDSCAVKSLTASMHSVLPDALYRRFKVFYTQQLMGDMNPGPKYDAASQILQKRKQKMNVN